MTTRILLIRHGETDWNASGRWQGMADIPLNSTGQMQAVALASHLKDRPITAIYSSDLQRAAQTARVIAAQHNLGVVEDARLRELNLGDFQGLTLAEITEKFPDEAVRMKQEYMRFVAPNGESRLMLQNRAYAAYLDITAKHPEGEVVIISHGGTIRTLLLKLFEGDHEAGHSPLSNTSVTIIETDGAVHKLVGTATTEHLGDVTPDANAKSDTL